MTREELADYLMPLVQTAVLATSLRKVADDIGMSHTTVGDFLRTGSLSDKYLEKVRRWAERVEGSEDTEDVSRENVIRERGTRGYQARPEESDVVTRTMLEAVIRDPGYAAATKIKLVDTLKHALIDRGDAVPAWLRTMHDELMDALARQSLAAGRAVINSVSPPVHTHEDEAVGDES